MSARPVIVQHCFGTLGHGGPMSGVMRLLQSELAGKYRFETCFQTRPAGGINFPLIREMAGRIRFFHPDLLHVRGLGNEGLHGLLAGRIAGCRKILVSVHGTQGDCPHSWRQWIVSRLLEPYTLRHADGVYCVCSYAERRKVIWGHARRLYGYIHNGVDLPPLNPPDPALRASFGFAASDTVAVYVGRLSTQKGLLDLCSACKLLSARNESRLKVLIVGDGPDRSLIQEAASELPPGMIAFSGKRDDINEIIRTSNFLVLPSHHENLPNVIIEAMACQRAVIASSVGGNPETVISGETGILVPPSDPTALADAMQELICNPGLCEAYGVAGRLRAESLFSMDCLMMKLDRIYQDLLRL